MCDTMVAVGSVTKNGNVIFAKNSDRESNESQVMLRIPRRKYDLSQQPKVKTTYIEVDQVEETFEIIISKPSWIWGCEMGSNEFGVTIGNEAVFTKANLGAESLIGMDMIRLALERTRTAKEALDYIIYLMDTYGQGGNCSSTKNMEYHNAFIIADAKEAYVLETADKYWVYKKVTDVYTISNGLTLENDFDAHHPNLISDCVQKGLCKGREDFNFRKLFAKPLYIKFSCCDDRSSLSHRLISKDLGVITVETMMNTLRGHQDESINHFENGSMKDVCLHAGSLISSQTTASFIAELKDNSEYWYTNSSLACISLFKPFTFSSDFHLLNEEKGTEFWMKHERIHRMLISKQLDEQEYKKQLNMIQNEIIELYTSAEYNTLNQEEQGHILKECLTMDLEFTEKMLEIGQKTSPKRIKGNMVFIRYWKKTNKQFAYNK